MLYTIGMYIATIPNRNSPPAILLRESYRQGGKIKSRTLANLSALPEQAIKMLRRQLKGENLVCAQQAFEIIENGSPAHGHVDAVLTAMKRLNFFSLIDSKPSAQRDLVVAMVIARILQPKSKLATSAWWHDTTLPDALPIGDTNEDDLYKAMDWLLERQGQIEKKLAKRHLHNNSIALYDLTSSYFEGSCCPLAARGHNRDRKKGKLQVNYGLLTNRAGIPLAVSVFKGNTGDPATLLPQVRKVREQFGIDRFVLVDDRGMLTQKKIDELRAIDGIDWIGALRPEAIKKLVKSEAVQMGLFDERNLFEVVHPDFPGERLIACRNDDLARKLQIKRDALLAATVKELQKVKRMVERGRLRGKGDIGIRTGKVINKYKVGKHFKLSIEDEIFDFKVKDDKVRTEALLDGIYVVRTSLNEQQMDAAETVRGYKQLSQVERAFRSFKTVDLMVRPIYHRLEDRVRAHIFLCMLAYYVQWHMMEAWRPLLFADEQQQHKATRDPVAPAKRSDEALKKASTKRLEDDSLVRSFQNLLDHLAAIVRATCRCLSENDQDATFTMITKYNPTQQKAIELLQQIKL
jgi:transposase